MTSKAKAIMITLSNSKNKHHIIVCCSGGADSMALLMMCCQYVNELRLRRVSADHLRMRSTRQRRSSHCIGIKYNHLLNSELPNQNDSITISAFHVKHGLSSNEHDWANLVQSKCDSLSIPLHIVEVNSHQRPLSETEARKLRYEALDEYITSKSLDGNTDVIVVTGHHKNDRFENYLISIFKNRTHNFDLINHVKNSSSNSVFNTVCHTISYQKPLLNMTKNELIDYCHQHQLDFVHDESNDVSDNLRNIIRNQLFKYMDKLKHKAQYMISLERFFDNYKTFNEFYMASVRQFISTMQVKKIGCKANNVVDNTDMVGSQLPLQLRLRYSCSMDELKQVSHGKYVEFVAHLVQILYNDYCSNLSSKNITNPNENSLKCVNRFNFQHFIQSFPKLECNNKQYKVDDFLCVWIKDGMLFIKIQAI